ncbi:thioesterase family protein [Comamonas humi]
MRISLPEQKKWVHDSPMDVRWGDMDKLGHVNNTVYFRYMETARVEWLHGLPQSPYSEGRGAVVVNAFCNFVRQIEYPARLVVKMYVSDAARTAFETWYEIEYEGQPGVVYATGGATVVWVDHVQRKAVELPESLRALVQE